jgi:DNA-binding NarL/FixJ family response regulator
MKPIAANWVTQKGGAWAMVRKVALIEDSAVIRASLREMLDDIPSFEVVGEYDHAGDAIAGITEQPVDIILLDLRLRGSNGMQVLKHVKASLPDAIVIVFSSQSDAINRERAIAAGAKMFLSKTDDIERLHDVLKELGAKA